MLASLYSDLRKLNSRVNLRQAYIFVFMHGKEQLLSGKRASAHAIPEGSNLENTACDVMTKLESGTVFFFCPPSKYLNYNLRARLRSHHRIT